MVLDAADPESFPILAQILSRGGVAVVPGDTMYGLVGVAPKAESRLRSVKGRGGDKPFLRLIAESRWIERFSDMPLPSKLARFWPGPLTLVFPARGGGTSALRVPNHPFLLDLLRELDQPLFSTSVNRSGMPPLRTVAEIRRELEADVDAIFDGGEQPPGAPSTLVDLTVRPFVVLRQGAVRLRPEDLLFG